MSRIPLSPRSIERLLSSSIPTICRACRIRLTAFPQFQNAPFSATAERSTTKFKPKQRFKLLQPRPIGPTGEPLRDEQERYRQDYEKAETWDGLEWVGGPKYLYEQMRLQRIEEKGEFQGFIPSMEVRKEEELHTAVIRAIKEILVLHALTQPFSRMKGLEAVPLDPPESWADSVELKLDEDGLGYGLSFSDMEAAQEAAEAFGLEKDVLDQQKDFSRTLTLRGKLDANNVHESILNLAPEQRWKNLPIESLPIRFAVRFAPLFILFHC